MYTVIKDRTYIVKFYGVANTFVVACQDINDLYRYIANEMVNHNKTFVNAKEIVNNGTLSKVKVFTDERFKSIYKRKMRGIQNGTHNQMS